MTVFIFVYIVSNSSTVVLALKLIEASQLKPGGKVLGKPERDRFSSHLSNEHLSDVGHGTGESLILLLSDSTIACPSSIIGLTSLPSHHRRSQERVTRLQSNSELTRCSNTQVRLLAGDAVWREDTTDHPLHPSSDDTFDAILALDCAYHFNTRHAFLVQSFHKLSPHGRIALADLCFASPALDSNTTFLLTSVLRMVPKQNVISAEDYVHAMSEIGYADVRLEDISEDVFPGFIKFLKSRGGGWWVFGIVMRWYTNTGVRFVIVSGSKP